MKVSQKDFKSKLEYEAYLDARKKVRGTKTKVTYETHTIPYSIVTHHEYTPDIPIVFKDGRVIFVEVKGYFRPEDRRKMLNVKRSNPDLDIRFLFPQDNKVYRKGKMRYSDWCKKYNFPYHIGTKIPKEWFNA